MTPTARTLASLRKIGDVHRKAGAVPIAVIDLLIRELEIHEPEATSELRALGARTELDRKRRP